jgi:hypothetical protein
LPAKTIETELPRGTPPCPGDSLPRTGLYQQTTFSGLALLGAATGAAFSQLLDSPTEWGQGSEGYGRRVASSYGATIINGTIQYGTSILFHEDNRYFRSTSSSFA